MQGKLFFPQIQVNGALNQDLHCSSRGICAKEACYTYAAPSEYLLLDFETFCSPCFSFSQSIKPEHDNDIYISGYSDAILRYAWLALLVWLFLFHYLLWNTETLTLV